MQTKQKLLIFVFSKQGGETSTTYGGFAKRLQKAGGLDEFKIVTVALENLAFVLNENGESEVFDTVSKIDLAEADLVYMKSWQSMPNEAAALAHYLFHKGVIFGDTLALGKGTSKIVTMFRQWGSGIRVPNSIYTTNSHTLKVLLQDIAIKKLLGEKFILKDVEGAKGKLNFHVTSDEAGQVLEQHPDVRFICQRFIPNQGDYRIGIYGDKPLFVLQRVGNGSSHLNNTSAGGTGTYLNVKDIAPKVLLLAQKAARASELQVAGVDLIQDAETGKWFVLEVNQGSQIVTGAFTAENMSAFNKGISSMARERKVRTRKQPRKIIGRRAVAKMPDLGIDMVVAKIDTGAYSSTLHAENIHLERDATGGNTLAFDIIPSVQLTTSSHKTVTIKTADFFIQKVRSSNGHLQERYSIRTKISLDGIRFSAILTLSDRSEMGYPFLVGRKLLRSRFVVNVELNENNEPDWRY